MSLRKDVLKKRIVKGTVATVVAAGVIAGAVYFNNIQSIARLSLDNIETLVSEHSRPSDTDSAVPFTVIEVVPNMADAQLGYLVGGEEPVYHGKSIKDMPSKDERTDATYGMHDQSGHALNGKAFEYTNPYAEVSAAGDGVTSVKIRGSFAEGGDKNYKLNNDAGSGYTKYIPEASMDEVLADPSKTRPYIADDSYAYLYENFVLYRKQVTYSEVGGNTGSNLALHIVGEGTLSDVPVNVSGEIYNFQYFHGEKITVEYHSSLQPGDYIYSGGDDLAFEGIIDSINDVSGDVTLKDPSVTLAKADITNESGTGTDYFVVTPDSSSLPLYRVSTVTGGGPYKQSDVFFAALPDYVYNATTCPPSHTYYYVSKGSEPDGYVFATLSSGTHYFTADYSLANVYQTFYYTGGFKNNEWFKTEVLDIPLADADKVVVDVIPVTIDKLGDYIDKANLVYFAGGTYGADINAEVARKLLNKSLEEDHADALPIVMEYSTYADNTANENLAKLALSLMQAEPKMVADATAWTALAPGDATTGLLSTLNIGKLSGAGAVDPTATDVSYVKNTFFLNDDKFAANGKVVSDNFLTAYSDAKATAGFQEIKDVNDNRDEFFDLTGKNKAEFNHTISKATSLRHVLNGYFANYNGKKDTLNILDIEPYATAQYNDQTELQNNIYVNGASKSGYKLTRDTIDKNWVVRNCYPDLKDKLDKINITQMGTKELIGRNEDLNSDYDMIYIGMDTAIMNTTLNDNTKEKTIATLFNMRRDGNPDMDDYVYSHVGDSVRYRPGDYSGAWVAANNQEDVHLSGNDLTSDKLRELSEYVQAGYAVVISDDFLNIVGTNVSVNTQKIDKASNMYKLINDVVLKKKDGVYLYFNNNVVTKSMLELNRGEVRNKFKQFIDVNKLSIEIIEQPPIFEDVTVADPKYIPANPDKTHSLKFHVKLNGNSNKTYDCKLYIDIDADGKFEEGEIVDMEIAGEDRVEGKYLLKTGHEYAIERVLHDEYVGFISWKLAFIQNEKQTEESTGNTNSVRSSIIGYSAIKPTTRPVINVLQITPNDEKTNTLDLAATEMEALYDQVNDFEIKIHKVRVEDYIKKNDPAYQADDCTYFDYLCKFDMVVIGFADAFAFEVPGNPDRVDIKTTQRLREQYYGAGTAYTYVNVARNSAYKDSILGIRDYVLSGRSILFTHDLSSYHQEETSPGMGWYANMYLRDIMGMDRFGYKAGDNQSLKYNFDHNLAMVNDYVLPEYKSVYDFRNIASHVAGQDDHLADLFAYTDADIMRFVVTGNGEKHANFGVTTRGSTASYNMAYAGDKSGDATETVTAVNEGQITRYPFRITTGVGGIDGSTFEVSMTHSQYYQLNLDTDSRDENDNDDVVVWYTISNNGPYKANSLAPYYKALYNDARNNYYIYNKGNVTYTGSGHSTVKSPMERRLFVNTLVAAFRNGIHAPRVIYKENPWNTAATITNMHLPYDPELLTSEGSAFLGKKLVVNFKTANDDLTQINKNLVIKYFCYIGENVAGADLRVGSASYKAITPLTLQIADTDGKLSDAGSFYSVKNYAVYQATFNMDDIMDDRNQKLTKYDSSVIYIQIGTEKEGLSTGTVAELKATESLTPLKLSTVKLVDLE